MRAGLAHGGVSPAMTARAAMRPMSQQGWLAAAAVLLAAVAVASGGY